MDKNIKARVKKEKAKVKKERKIKAQFTKLNEKKTFEVEISDHAVVRFLQRMYEIDTDLILSEMLTNDDVEKIRIMGTGSFILDNGFKVRFVDNVIITLFK